MPDQESRIRLLAVDETAAALRSATSNFNKFQSQVGKSFAPGQKGAGDFGKSVQGSAKQAGDSLDVLGRKATSTRRGLLDIGRGAADVGVRGTGAFKALGGAIEGGNAALMGMAGRFLGVAGAAEVARQSFLGFASVDQRMRLMQNQAGATKGAIDATTESLKRLAVDTATPLDQLIEGFDALREGAGLSLKETEAIFPQVAKAAKGMGANVADMSDTVGTLMRNMNLPAEKVGVAMDMIAKGVFDLRLNADQLTKNMPKLTESMAEWGYTGEDGVARMMAMLGSLQKVTGNTGKSAMLLSKMFENLGDPAVSQALGDTPEGLRESLKAAQAQGKDVMGVIIGMIEKSTDKDAILQKFNDKERGAIRQLIKDYRTMGGTINDVKNSANTAMGGFNNVMDGPQAKIDQMVISLGNLSKEFGSLLHELGTTDAIKAVTRQIQQLQREIKNVKALWDWWKTGKTPEFMPKDIREWTDTLWGDPNESGISNWIQGQAPFEQRFTGPRGSTIVGDPVEAEENRKKMEEALRKRAEGEAARRGADPSQVTVSPPLQGTVPIPHTEPAEPEVTPTQPSTATTTDAEREKAKAEQAARLKEYMERKAQERLNELNGQVQETTEGLKRMSLALPDESEARVMKAAFSGFPSAGANTGFMNASYSPDGGGVRFASLGDGGFNGQQQDNTPIGRAFREQQQRGGGGSGADESDTAAPPQGGNTTTSAPPTTASGTATDAGRPASGQRAERIAAAKAAMEDQLRREGVPEANVKEASNLLAGQALAESGLDPKTVHDKGTGYGIYGARHGRRDKMLKWMAEHGYAKDSVEGQSRYMAHEAMTDPEYKKSKNALMTATPENRAAGTEALIKNFERPQDQGPRQQAARMKTTAEAAGVQAGPAAPPGVATQAPTQPPAQVASLNPSSGVPPAPNAAQGANPMGPQQALAYAQQHLGADEMRDQTKLQSFFREQGINLNPRTTAWCAAFVNSSLKKAGVVGPEGGKAVAAGAFTKWGTGVKEGEKIQAGDVGVVKGRSPRTGMEGKHVGMLTGETRTVNGQLQYKMIGGNEQGKGTGGDVREVWRPASSLHVRRAPVQPGQQPPTAVARPALAAAPPAGAAAPPPVAQAPPAAAPEAPKPNEVDRPLQMNVKVNDNEVQFARSSMRRQADREVREARWSSYSDIGAA